MASIEHQSGDCRLQLDSLLSSFLSVGQRASGLSESLSSLATAIQCHHGSADLGTWCHHGASSLSSLSQASQAMVSDIREHPTGSNGMVDVFRLVESLHTLFSKGEQDTSCLIRSMPSAAQQLEAFAVVGTSVTGASSLVSSSSSPLSVPSPLSGRFPSSTTTPPALPPTASPQARRRNASSPSPMTTSPATSAPSSSSSRARPPAPFSSGSSAPSSPLSGSSASAPSTSPPSSPALPVISPRKPAALVTTNSASNLIAHSHQSPNSPLVPLSAGTAGLPPSSPHAPSLDTLDTFVLSVGLLAHPVFPERTAVPFPNARLPADVAQSLGEDIIRTERDYVSRLTQVVQFFYYPYITNDKLAAKIGHAKDLLIGSAKELHALHFDRLADLEAHARDGRAVSYLIERLQDCGVLYPLYICRLKRGLARLDELRNHSKTFATFLKEREKASADALALHDPSKESSGSELTDLLQAPLQIVGQYRTFLRSAKFATSGDDASTEQQQNIAKALELVDRLSSAIATATQQYENVLQQRLVQLEFMADDQNFPAIDLSRKLVRRGVMLLVSAKGGLIDVGDIAGGSGDNHVSVFVFSDVVLIGRRHKKSAKGESQGVLEILGRVWLYKAEVKSVADSDPSKSGGTISIAEVPLSAFVLRFNKADNRVSWSNTLQKAVDAARRYSVFGNDIAQVVLSREMHVGLGVPRFVVESTEQLLNNALDTEGLFRLSAPSSEVNALSDPLNRGKKVVWENVVDFHAITVCLKVWLSEMPSPLMTFELYNDFVSSQDDSLSPQERTSRLREVTAMMPEPNRKLVAYLARVCAEVCARSAVNKMTVEAISVIFGPTLLRRPGIEALRLPDEAVYKVFGAYLRQWDEVFVDDDATAAYFDHHKRGRAGSASAAGMLSPGKFPSKAPPAARKKRVPQFPPQTPPPSSPAGTLLPPGTLSPRGSPAGSPLASPRQSRTHQHPTTPPSSSPSSSSSSSAASSPRSRSNSVQQQEGTAAAAAATMALRGSRGANRRLTDPSAVAALANPPAPPRTKAPPPLMVSVDGDAHQQQPPSPRGGPRAAQLNTPPGAAPAIPIRRPSAPPRLSASPDGGHKARPVSMFSGPPAAGASPTSVNGGGRGRGRGGRGMPRGRGRGRGRMVSMYNPSTSARDTTPPPSHPNNNINSGGGGASGKFPRTPPVKPGDDGGRRQPTY